MYELCLHDLYIIGAGIHVRHSINHNTGSSFHQRKPQPANSYAVVDTGAAFLSYYGYKRIEIGCCSNSSIPPNGSFTFPNGHTTSSNYGNANVYRSDNGCYIFAMNNTGIITLLYSGVYTCSIDDSNGNNIDVHIGLYEEGFNSKHNGS